MPPSSSSTTRTNSTPYPIRCGVVGVGRMGRHHARVYAELPGATLVGVVDADEERRSAVADRHGCPAFESVDQLLAAGVEAVSIAVRRPITSPSRRRCSNPTSRA